ncbi:MAG: hypothetical protein JJU06_17430 [Ectothiorhodospiraceae bacterium]|nr:hypothetical protein [Ectothiorhodospiraceae bacterium]MCH8502686.1 ethylbenzene dehydrogenase-related protein [Ectothiorhodospiraceae bacterium]
MEAELEDEEQNIFLPVAEERTDRLKVAVLYNDSHVQIRYEYPTDRPSWYHQVWKYEDGEWVRYGSGGRGPDQHGLYEDRISMMLDDGSVDGFDRYGGWMLAHEGMRTLGSAADADAVREHPKLGRDMGRSDVRKYLPGTRDAEPEETSWDRVKDDETLRALQENGYFLDLWQWRAHRSHPVGHADNGYVLHYRLSSEGRGMYTDNWNDDAGQPAYMLDPGKTGKRALRWEKLLERGYSQDDAYFISEDNATAFDPDHDWQEGDVIPQRFLRQPEGSRGAISAGGRYQDGAWRIRLTRTLESPNPLDSKALEPGGSYTVAFAVHSGGVGARWHRVSLPQSLSLGDDGDADIQATRVEGNLDEAGAEWTDIPLVYPGQVTWQWLHGDHHPGSPLVRQGALGVRDMHDTQQLSDFIADHERRLKDQ